MFDRWLGVLWGVLTLAFEILFGRFVVGASWERLASDYNVLEGGLLPFGMIVLVLSPWIAGKVRGMLSNGKEPDAVGADAPKSFFRRRKHRGR